MTPARIFSGICLILSALPLVWGCERAGPLPPELGSGPAASFAQIQSNILDRNCALPSCHIGASPPLGLNLSAGNALSNVVGVPSLEIPRLFRVEPGNPDSSYLVMKIEGAPGILGARMPFGRTPLSAAEIRTIRQWIADGAPDN